jgi:hypothetical protein
MIKDVIMRVPKGKGKGTPVILIGNWRKILRAIWRNRKLQCRSAGRLSGQLRNVRQPWDQDAKPDSMIVGRESGPSRDLTASLPSAASYRSKNAAT